MRGGSVHYAVRYVRDLRRYGEKVDPDLREAVSRTLMSGSVQGSVDDDGVWT